MNGADPEEAEPEHRLGDLRLDEAEDREQTTRPPPISDITIGLVQPIDVAAVGLDAVGDADEDRDQAGGEGQVAAPGRAWRACATPSSLSLR